MSKTASVSFRGGNVSPGQGIHADMLKPLWLKRQNPVAGQTDQNIGIYDPLTGATLTIPNDSTHKVFNFEWTSVTVQDVSQAVGQGYLPVLHDSTATIRYSHSDSDGFHFISTYLNGSYLVEDEYTVGVNGNTKNTVQYDVNIDEPSWAMFSSSEITTNGTTQNVSLTMDAYRGSAVEIETGNVKLALGDYIICGEWELRGPVIPTANVEQVTLSALSSNGTVYPEVDCSDTDLTIVPFSYIVHNDTIGFSTALTVLADIGGIRVKLRKMSIAALVTAKDEGSGGITQVNHDSTMTGSGTLLSPLGVNSTSSIDASTPSAIKFPTESAIVSFVNYMVSTYSAKFLGTLSETDDLGLPYTSTNAQIEAALAGYTFVNPPSNNDYCFVEVNDPQTSPADEYRRFSFDGSSWHYQYTINSTAFAPSQWDAINSGVNSTKVQNYDDHLVDIANPHSVTKSQVGLGNVSNDAQVKRTEMGAADGVATLDATSKLPLSQLPITIDPLTGDTSKFFNERGNFTAVPSDHVVIDATVDSLTGVVTCATTQPELQDILDAGKIPVISMVTSNGTEKWMLWYRGSESDIYKFASTDNERGYTYFQNCLGYITSVHLRNSGGNWVWTDFNNNTFYDAGYTNSRFLSNARFAAQYDKCIELPVGLQYTQIAYLPEDTEGDIRSVFDIALWDGLNSVPQELRFEVYINADHSEIQIKPLKFVRGYKPYGTYYFDYTGRGIGKIYVEYLNHRFYIYVGLKAVVPSGINVDAYIHCYDLKWVPVSSATSVTEPVDATSIDVIGDYSNVYIYYTDDYGAHGEERSAIAELDYALSVGNKTILLYDSGSDNNYYQYAGKHTDNNHTNWYRFEGGIIENSGFFSRKIVDIKTTDGDIQRNTINIPACNSSGVVDIANLPTASSVTNGDTTHVPTADAVYKNAVQKTDGNASFGNETGYKALGKISSVDSLNSDLCAVIEVTILDDLTIPSTSIVFIDTRRYNDTYQDVRWSHKKLNSIASDVSLELFVDSSYNIWLYAHNTSASYCSISIRALSITDQCGTDKISRFTAFNNSSLEGIVSYAQVNPSQFGNYTFSNGGTGSASQPVYVDANGQVQPCNVVRRYGGWTNAVRFTKSLSTAWNDGRSVVITSASYRHHKTMFSISFVISGTITASNPLGTDGSVRIVRMNNNTGNPPTIYYKVTDGVVEFVINGMNGLTTNCPIYVDEYGISTTLSSDWSNSGYSIITNPTRITPSFTTF